MREAFAVICVLGVWPIAYSRRLTAFTRLTLIVVLASIGYQLIH